MIIKIEKTSDTSPVLNDGYLIEGFPLAISRWVDLLEENEHFLVFEVGGEGPAELSSAQILALNSNPRIKAWEIM